MAAPLASVREIEREVATLRFAPGEDMPYQRTSVMTHTAWVPPEWVEAAEDVLAGLAERHPSRTIVLVPEPDAEDGLEAVVDVDAFQAGEGRQICAETIHIHLKGKRASAPASVVQPLFLPDLPVFLRWRGVPSFGSDSFGSLVDVVDRLIVDSTEWPDLPAPYGPLADVFDRVVVSDIAWARRAAGAGSSPRSGPASGTSRRFVSGHRRPGAPACRGGCVRDSADVELEHEPSDLLVGVEIDGNPAPFPPGEPPPPSDLLSAELDRFERDLVYEEAVRSAAR
jgi:Glucose-6-P dehydrogenase subunit